MHASNVVPATGSRSVLLVEGDALADDEDEVNKVEAEPVGGVPWIPSCVHPATSAVDVATTAIHLIFIG
ncbi:hypothetical protein MA6G0728R_1303 [Mycobacteroides abscessus 6G-0728-R]|uniref:Uncharacterized protein n=1 Tax=Mycobacteroides abscessus (strain ATCC 19977 / DSM 44196 / CCUG 20993 / CIP 104536 / JCM 13569 / NCTC 13031 / TMC 1543 / L948) TaxID=561007 RepID=B1MKS8_MYCA9|nr:hypothetical protein MA4S0726RA_1125 [Mycobacteroides abscessus 4S-0726-RA]EIT99603.1 hypothetical protein MA4S0303_1592 [Mycobacteroides abscessus 4S-0303]EIU02096.1 hypothetical protein MA4S0726RB_0704 [Mycobacteroides abscessus 4S-0726-RB]EIV00547.1 hypothetical protein MA6G0728R_1303 [Mycobacteroides abscessus 6G-0728-R]EIV68917.1 hypothetical protein MA4S0116S_0253 [Mycobacteroides abscessus 4S-0116-S]EUA77568.1 hypothetical protein I541_2035 [Mycobacteroides abscessus]CAM61370.1 Hypo